MMEVYAGALSHADYNTGRLLDAVEQSGQLDNTLVIFMMGDNGASAEGTLQGTTNEVAMDETDCIALWRHPQRHGDVVADSDQG
jgi:arylsulfatase A-like enzyme